MRDPLIICNLLVSEFVVLVLLVAFITFTFISALVISFRGGFQKSKINLVGWLIIAASLLGIACLYWGFFIEPQQLEVTETTIHNKKLQGGKHFRIVHISDLHCDLIAGPEEKLPELMPQLKPDLILFTGDAINTHKSLNRFRRIFAEISKVAPVYVVKGNHDTRCYPDVGLFSRSGKNVQELESTTQSIKINGVDATITGVPIDSENNIQHLISVLEPDKFNIFIYHYPSIADFLSKTPVDLFLCGHTHGGQVRLPFYGAIITRSLTGKKYESGYYKVKNMDMYVNRGIGMVGGSAPKIRFLCKPEVSVLNIQE